MPLVEFIRDNKDADPSYDKVYVNGKYLGLVEQCLETDYLDALDIPYVVKVLSDGATEGE